MMPLTLAESHGPSNALDPPNVKRLNRKSPEKPQSHEFEFKFAWIRLRFAFFMFFFLTLPRNCSCPEFLMMFEFLISDC